jgi:putative membrane protein insertion efficiency factor
MMHIISKRWEGHKCLDASKFLENFTMQRMQARCGLGCRQLLQWYRIIFSPLKKIVLGPQAACRFYPTCSEYAMEALRLHPLGRAMYLTIRRLLRCHPWSSSAIYNPVPLGRDKGQCLQMRGRGSILGHGTVGIKSEHRALGKFR